MDNSRPDPLLATGSRTGPDSAHENRHDLPQFGGSVSRGRSLLLDGHQVPYLPPGGQLRQMVFVSRLIVPPPAATKPNTPIALARSSGSTNSDTINESDTAETTAPPNP